MDRQANAAGIVVPDWPAPARVRAFTTTRLLSGQSQPPFDRFNLGLRSGDDEPSVRANRDLLARAFDLPSPPRWLRQVHGTRVATFDTSGIDPYFPHPNPPPQAGEGDETKARRASASERCNANHRSQAGEGDETKARRASVSERCNANHRSQAGEGDETKARRASAFERCNANHRSQAGEGDALGSAVLGRGFVQHFPPPQAGEGNVKAAGAASSAPSLADWPPPPPAGEGWGGGEPMPHGGDQSPRNEPEGDAAVTSEPGVVLAILTADCLPVLLCADTGDEVAAAHAGWRGLAAGVLEKTVMAMNAQPERILAWLGPAAGPQAYEVGEQVRSAFVDQDTSAASAFVATRPGHWLCDLYALARLRLALVGVTRVYGGGLCTISDPQRFYSFRRDGARSGRMASLIYIKEPVGSG